MTRNLQDILGGLLMSGIGLFVALYGNQYEFGSPARMGPGFFPVVLGWVLAGLGALLTLVSLSQQGTRIQIQWTNLACVIGAVVAFAFALRTIGLIPATFIATVIASLADRDTSWMQRLVLGVAVAGLSALIFKMGLDMVLPLWWWGD